ncbi:MAG: serine hydrolase [bacterium]|nr:serine hydrolase [bacterium]
MADYFPPSDAEGGWRTCHPSDVGMDAGQLDETFEFIQGTTKNGGLAIVKDGHLVYERYFGKGHRNWAPNSGSCGKSFTSIAMGILLGERPDRFPDGLDQKVFTPDYLPPAVFPLRDARMANIRLGHLLTMTAGIRGNNPGRVKGKNVILDPVGPDGWQGMADVYALGLENGETNGVPFTTQTLWCDPGGGYSYATASIHIASVILRRVTGMELQDYLSEKVAGPIGWGRWNFAYRNAKEVDHTPGGGGIALRASDMLRFLYLLLHRGRWFDQQIVPESFVNQCAHPSPYNCHDAYSLQFDVNGRGDHPALPSDAYWKAGSGGHAHYVVPSKNLVVWKLGGRDDQYGEHNTGMAVPSEAAAAETSRENWKKTVEDGPALLRTLEGVLGAVLTPANGSSVPY